MNPYQYQSEVFLTATLSSIAGQRIPSLHLDWNNDSTYSMYFEVLSARLREAGFSGLEHVRKTDDANRVWRRLFSSPNFLVYCKAIAFAIDHCTLSRIPAARGGLLLSLDNAAPCHDALDRRRFAKKMTEIADRFENAEDIYLFDPLGSLSADIGDGFRTPSRFVIREHFLELLSVLSQFPNMVITGHPLSLLVSALGHCKKTFFPGDFLAEFIDHELQFCSSETTIF